MKVLLMSIGTRGDCEPFLAIANQLKNRGDEVICVFPEQYRSLAEEENFEFHSFGAEFVELLNSDEGRYLIAGKNSAKKFEATLKLYKSSAPMRKNLLDIQHKLIESIDPDCIIFHPKVIYPISWSLKTGKNIVLLCPVPCAVHPIEGFASIGINKNLGKLCNKWSYDIVNYIMGMSLKMASKAYFDNEYSTKRLTKALKDVKIIYSVSKALMDYQEGWGDNINIAGFLERDKVHAWSMPDGLELFLSRHPKIILVTFGSMVNIDPELTTAMVLDALKECKIPAIINTAGGGLVKPAEHDEKNIFFTDNIPYDYILPRMYATIHHGGAGTTHSSLKSGCATMAIPHAVDQPLWNRWIYNLGVGPLGVSINKLSTAILKEKLLDLYNTSSYKQNALRLSKQMKNDNDYEQLYNFIIN